MLVLSSKVALLVKNFGKNKQLREQAARLRKAEARERGQQLATSQLESLNRYRLLADAVPHIIWKFQADGTPEYCNRLWLLYSGLSTEQNSGRGWQSTVHPDDLENFLRHFKDYLVKGEPFEIECRLLRNVDGCHRWHILRAVPDLLPSGEAGSWIITCTDIHDRKKIEEDLIRAKEESAAANQAKTAFLANMSHEIRTPLGIVLGFSELLANPDIEIEKRQEYYLSVKKNGELLSRLIGDVLDLSKIEAGHMDVEKIQFSLPDLLLSSIQAFQNQAREKNVRLVTNLKTPIPQEICTDPLRMRQILFNIVSNAIKFTDGGDVTLNVEIATNSDCEKILQISVMDQGLGITPDQAHKLFQPFIQADNSTTRRYGGTGLGLSLSRRLARQLNGDVIFSGSNEGGRGSTFVITICVGPLNADTAFVARLEDAKPPAVEEAKTDYNLKGTHILIVDDVPENLFLLRHFLTSVGAKVTSAENGFEGVEKAMAGDFDIVLMDIQMPVLDGYQATRQLRKRGYKTPILALTAYALKEERERCLAAGCNDHLTKPINRDELMSAIIKFTLNHFQNRPLCSTSTHSLADHLA